MKRVSFEPCSLILPTENVLYVLNQRGVATVRSKNIHRVYQALEQYLDGRYDEETLIEAARTVSQPIIRNFLTKMCEAGAIRIEEDHSPGNEALQGQASTPDPLRATQPNSSLIANGCFVSLTGADHAAAREHNACIFFIEPVQLLQELLTIDRWSRPESILIYVVASSRADDVHPPLSGLDLRASYARWLSLNIERPHRAARGVKVYQLDATKGTLAEMLVIDGTSSTDLRDVPARLGLITPADVDQSPLAVAKAAHDLFPLSFTRFGPRHDEILFEEMVCEFMARVLLSVDEKRASSPTFSKTIGAQQSPIDAAGAKVYGEPKTDWNMATSLLDLRVALLESYAAARAAADATPISARDVRLLKEAEDLLRDQEKHIDLKYLGDVLQLRQSDLTARLKITGDGLFIYETGAHRSSSFIRAKALRDILLSLTREAYYADALHETGQAGLRTDFSSFINKAQLRGILRDRQAELSGKDPKACFRFFKFQGWGRTAWTGNIEV